MALHQGVHLWPLHPERRPVQSSRDRIRGLDAEEEDPGDNRDREGGRRDTEARRDPLGRAGAPGQGGAEAEHHRADHGDAQGAADLPDGLDQPGRLTAPEAPGLLVTSTSTRSPASLRTAASSAARESVSAQCRSSTTTRSTPAASVASVTTVAGTAAPTNQASSGCSDERALGRASTPSQRPKTAPPR